MNTENMIQFMVGDHVFYEKSECSPYWIGRIEMFKRTPTGNIMAKILCYYRRCNLPSRTMQMVDEMASDDTDNDPKSNNLYQAKHRELYLTTQTEMTSVLQFRGKCNITLLSDTEIPMNYVSKDNFFYYFFSFNNMNNSLSTDKKEIQVGTRYQTEVPELLKDGECDGRISSDLETLLWTPNHEMTNEQIDTIMIVSRSVGILARAVDCSTDLKAPLLQQSAAAASRDVTILNAMELIHRNNYNTDAVLRALVQRSGLMMYRDEMETWSVAEANLFQGALDIYGKNFTLIRAEVLPWKSIKNIVEYYYMWKTTDRSLQLKRLKLDEDLKLQDVHMPCKVVEEPDGTFVAAAGSECYSCSASTTASWHAWGPIKRQLCHECWVHWKKYGCHQNRV